jgi:hypothetical protein
MAAARRSFDGRGPESPFLEVQIVLKLGASGHRHYNVCMLRTVLLTLGLCFFGAIVWAMGVGSLGSEASEIWALPWGKIMFADLYLGFLVFAVIVFLVEPNKWLAAAVVITLFVLGNGVALFYLAARYITIHQLLKRSHQ